MKANNFQKSYQDWNCFSQSIPIETTKSRLFRLQASVKVIGQSNQSLARLWVRVENTNKETIFFDNMSNNPIQSKQWKKYIIDGIIDETASKIYFGGLCKLNGTFYFSDFELFIQTNETELEQVNIQNPFFENTLNQLSIAGWQQGTGKKEPVKINNYSFFSEKIQNKTNYCLKIIGENIFNSDSYSKTVYSQNAHNIVFTLNSLTSRLTNTIEELTLKQIDYQINPFENTIGMLLIHITAIEFYYQVYTFEKRLFNEKEKNKWQIAIDLNKEAAKKYKERNLNYYIDKHIKVRKNTIKGLKTMNEDWFNEKPLSSSKLNNLSHWLHVIEHQSYHLGQICLLNKLLKKTK